MPAIGQPGGQKRSSRLPTLNYHWRGILGRASVADVDGDSLYVHRDEAMDKTLVGSGQRRAFIGRINGVIVVRGLPTMWQAQRETELTYLKGERNEEM